MLRILLALSGALAAGVAGWLSFGALAVTSDDGAAARVGALPPVSLLAVLLAVAIVAVVVWRPDPGRAAPLFLSLLLWLPWLPGEIPAAFGIWTGPVAVGVWAAIALALVAGGARWESIAARTPWLTHPGRAAITAGLIALAIYLVAGWRVSYRLPGGDEPHYLVITQSLLYDGDLQIENNHQRGDYHAYFDGELRPDYLRRGRNRQIYSVHAPGLAAVIAPAFALGGYPGVVIFLALAAAAASVLAWRVAFEVTGHVAAAWFGWAATTLTSPFIFHAFTIYPDGIGATLVLVGVWCLMGLRSGAARTRETTIRLTGAGVALALLPWLHTRYAVLAGVIGMLILLRLVGRPDWLREALTFLAVPVVSALGWFWFFYSIYGRFNPTVVYGGYRQGSAEFVPAGLLGLVFDQQFGLIPNAPVYLCAIAGLFVGLLVSRTEMPTDGSARRRLIVELLVIVLPYLAAATSYRMWWGGWSPPARFAVPVLLLQCIPAAIFWRTTETRLIRALGLVSLGLSLAIVLPMVVVERGFLIYNERDGFSLWLEWVNRTVDLAMALPSLHRDSGDVVLRDVRLWALALGSGVLVAFASRRTVKRAGPSAAVALGISGVVLMAGASLVWRAHGLSGAAPTPSQLDFLRNFRPAATPLGIEYAPLRLVSAEEIPGRMRVPPFDRIGRRLISGEKPLIAFPLVPAGSYELHVDASPPAGELTLRVGRTPLTIDRVSLAHAANSEAKIAIRFPVQVHSLQVFADERGKQAIRGLWLRPVAIRPQDLPYARYATRYGRTVVFFLDEHVFPERPGFWVRGGWEASLVVAPDRPGPTVRMFLRNARVGNEVTVSSGQWRLDLRLKPGEERSLDVPIDPDLEAAPLRINSPNGFRPADLDENSHDQRFLGVWIEPR